RIDFEQVDDLFLTHLDRDHFHPGWVRGMPSRILVHIHQRHFRRALQAGLHPKRLRALEDDFTLHESLRIQPILAAHDDLGVVAFRFEVGEASARVGGESVTAGFATDLGRVPDELVDHLHDVDLLAIESNYCPRLQKASTRPDFLKRRIMGGAGHLSNEQCAEAVRAIAPTQHVVLLHLSQECNKPDRAAAFHGDAPYALTLSSQSQPTPWIRPAARRRIDVSVRAPAVPTSLFA
ncbi:MAG: MBL fold metallo-hydrolase, partial [Planctomycetota bacterium]|nr:MBL fold metallo-hydrolase [Planctomycetota bacterium]